MNRILAPKLRVAVLTAASALMAIAPGCSSGGKITPTATQLPITNSSNSATTSGHSISTNNARDLAGAQPESVITGLGGARDLDLSGGGGGGGGGGGAVQPLTTDSLGAMLQSMGVNTTLDNGRYVMKFKVAGESNNYFVFPIEIGVSKNRTLVWIMSNTGTVEREGITGQALMDLLVANFQMAPTFFVVDSKHWLTMQLPVTNAGITPQVLAYNLNMFLANLKAAEPLYKGFMGSAGGGDNGGGGGGGGGGGDQGGDNPFK